MNLLERRIGITSHDSQMTRTTRGGPRHLSPRQAFDKVQRRDGEPDLPDLRRPRCRSPREAKDNHQTVAPAGRSSSLCTAGLASTLHGLTRRRSSFVDP